MLPSISQFPSSVSNPAELSLQGVPSPEDDAIRPTVIHAQGGAGAGATALVLRCPVHKKCFAHTSIAQADNVHAGKGRALGQRRWCCATACASGRQAA